MPSQSDAVFVPHHNSHSAFANFGAHSVYKACASCRFSVTLFCKPGMPLQERFPQYAIPEVPDQEYDVKERIDNSKAAKELGLKLTQESSTFIDAVVTLIQLGIAQPLPSGAPHS